MSKKDNNNHQTDEMDLIELINCAMHYVTDDVLSWQRIEFVIALISDAGHLKYVEAILWCKL